MTRTTAILVPLFALFAVTAAAQTYVRPSKGAPIPAFSGADAGILLSQAGSPTPLLRTGIQYEWTAFEAVRVRVEPLDCSVPTLQYTVSQMNTVIRPLLSRTGSGTGTTYTLIMQDAAGGAPLGGSWYVGNFQTIVSPNSVVNLSTFFLGCTVRITLTPVPFAPAFVPELQTDGGYAFMVQSPDTSGCDPNTSNFTKVWMDGGAQLVNPSNSNRYIVVTNVGDDLGGGTGIMKCRTGLAAPTLTAGSVGTVLLPNYSVVYTRGATVKCIGAGVWAGVYECIAP